MVFEDAVAAEGALGLTDLAAVGDDVDVGPEDIVGGDFGL